MNEQTINNDHAHANLEIQPSGTITRKISFRKETYRNLVTIATREHFDSKIKQDEAVGITLDKIINSYFKQYWIENNPNL